MTDSPAPTRRTLFKQPLIAYGPLCLLGLFLALLIVMHSLPDTHESLTYFRVRLQQEPWLAATHLLVHLNWQHLLLNATGLVCLYILFNDAFASLAWLGAVVVSAVISAYGMYYYSPDIAWCVGLSGALHGLFVYVVLRTGASWLWLAGIAIKLIIEQTELIPHNALSNATAQWIDNPVVVDAHLWGTAGGLVFYGFIRGITLLMLLIELNKTDSKA